MSSQPTPADLDELLMHSRWVRALARRLLADEQHAEDVAQDVFRVAVEQRPHGGPGLKAWLRRIVHQLASNTRRREGRRRAREARVARDEAVPQPDLLAWSERMRAVVEAVDALPEPYRKTVMLRYFEEKSTAEVARLLGVSPETVRTRLKRGLDRLRERLRAHWGGPEYLSALAGLVPGGTLPGFPAGPAGAPPSLGPGGLLVSTSSKLLAGAAILLIAVLLGLIATTWPKPLSDEARFEGARAGASAEAASTETAAGLQAVSDGTAPPRREGGAVVSTDEVSVAVRVVDGQTGAPVAGATVYVLDSSLLSEPDVAAADERFGRHRPMVAELHGRRHRADDDGRARIRLEASSADLYASADGLWGEARWSGSDREERSAIEIRLFQDVGFSVQVVDEQGRPQEGVPVAYCADELLRDAQELLSMRTDADGRVRFAHVGALLRWASGGGRIVEQGARIQLPLAPMDFAHLGRANEVPAGGKEVRLVLPPTASVEVELIDREGRRLDGRPWVTLQRRMPEARRARYSVANPDGFLGASALGVTQVRAESGVARFPRVGLGLELEVACAFEFRGEQSVLRAAGPTVAGESLRMTLHEGRATPGVRGALLDERGEPWTEDCEVWMAWLEDDAQHVTRIRTRSMPGEAGAFEARLAGAPLDTALHGRIWLVAEDPGAVRVWASPWIERLSEEGLDLGTLRLESSPLFAGRVLPQEGLDLSRVQVHAGGRAAAAAFADPAMPRHERAVMGEMTGALETWADAEGGFALYFPPTWLDEAYLRARPHSDDRQWQAVRLEPPPGSDDLRIELASWTGVRGRLLLDPGIAERVHVRTVETHRFPDGASEVLQGHLSLDSDGSFAEPGAATTRAVVVVAPRAGAVLHRFTLPAVAEGECVEIDPIDLRGVAVERVVRVVAEDGSELEKVGILLEDVPSDPGRQESTNPAVFLIPAQGARALVWSPGMHARVVPLTESETTVVLEPGIPVTVTVTGKEGLPEGVEVSWGARLVASPFDGANAGEGFRGIGGASGEAGFLPCPGTWQIGPGLYLPSRRLRMGLPGTEIEVPRGMVEPLEVTVAIDAEKVAEMLERLRDR